MKLIHTKTEKYYKRGHGFTQTCLLQASELTPEEGEMVKRIYLKDIAEVPGTAGNRWCPCDDCNEPEPKPAPQKDESIASAPLNRAASSALVKRYTLELLHEANMPDPYPNDFKCWVRVFDRKTGFSFKRRGYGKFIGNFSPIWISLNGQYKQLTEWDRETIPESECAPLKT
jgi:hypothetical protein